MAFTADRARNGQLRDFQHVQCLQGLFTASQNGSWALQLKMDLGEKKTNCQKKESKLKYERALGRPGLEDTVRHN